MFSSVQLDSTTLAIALLLPFISFLGIGLLFYQKKQKKKAEQKQGIQAIKYVTKLIKMIQQHRGLSYGCLRGDDSLRKSLISIESSIQSHLISYQTEYFNTETKERWDGFNTHWKKLLQSNLKVSPENNLEQHNLMISNLLFLVEDLAESNFLIDKELPDTNDSISSLWRDILRTAEWVGQARALGTGIAAAGECSSVERIRIKFIRGKIHAKSETLNAFYTSNSISSQDASADLLVHLARFLDTLDNRLIGPTSPTVSASEYFDLATTAINTFIDLFDRKLLNYSQIIDGARQPAQKQPKDYIVGSTANA